MPTATHWRVFDGASLGVKGYSMVALRVEHSVGRRCRNRGGRWGVMRSYCGPHRRVDRRGRDDVLPGSRKPNATAASIPR